ncbi:hypothetical protein TcasGA2_TC015734 [Tribolium castaneum]|uniref:Uncharacterized protein n=1 Tax=Tribolium castaneum TaxID=7070 RepID=D2A3Q7_TRICA|nr:hypothetical protein TcasGA2_TC015734 [Tribolium castaneum]
MATSTRLPPPLPPPSGLQPPPPPPPAAAPFCIRHFLAQRGGFMLEALLIPSCKPVANRRAFIPCTDATDSFIVSLISIPSRTHSDVSEKSIFECKHGVDAHTHINHAKRKSGGENVKHFGNSTEKKFLKARRNQIKRQNISLGLAEMSKYIFIGSKVKHKTYHKQFRDISNLKNSIIRAPSGGRGPY